MRGVLARFSHKRARDMEARYYSARANFVKCAFHIIRFSDTENCNKVKVLFLQLLYIVIGKLVEI